MAFYADLHVHSKHSRVASRDSDLENLAWWAGRKGISVLGTGDFTHPDWLEEIRDKLVPDDQRGLLRLRDDLETARLHRSPRSCRQSVHFMLSVEVSTIYKKEDRTRHIHHLIYLPDLDAAERFNRRLSRLGNLSSDGRPVLRIDSRDLLEVTLESDPEAYLVPAHIWRPGFALLSEGSGFERVEECYEDLAPHIFAIETGLSSDPPMNWRVSALDRFRLLSNSDAHSPTGLARQATVFTQAPDYFAIRRALETGAGYVGTVESFPQATKYHLGGHRGCGLHPDSGKTNLHKHLCPQCRRPDSAGVSDRVATLADRRPGPPPATAGAFARLIPLPEIVGELGSVGPGSKRVFAQVSGLVERLGPELEILLRVPEEDLEREGSTLLREAIARLRRGEVLCRPGYDGQPGEVRLFRPSELEHRVAGATLFASTEAEEANPTKTPPTPIVEALQWASLHDGPGNPAPPHPHPRRRRRRRRAGVDPLSGLSDEQCRAAEHGEGQVLLLGGPGTGKTHTIAHRLAHLIDSGQARAKQCLTLTSSGQAARELERQVTELLPRARGAGTITTPRRLGMQILREHRAALGLRRGFRVADDEERGALVQEWFGLKPLRSRQLLSEISQLKRTSLPRQDPSSDTVTEASALIEHYRQQMADQGLVDIDDVLELPVRLLERDPTTREAYRRLHRWIAIDDYPRMDALQYRLVRALAPASTNLCAAGDLTHTGELPDTTLRFEERFRRDYPASEIIELGENRRSSPPLVAAARNFITVQEPPAAVSDENGRPAALAEDTPTGPIRVFQARTERGEGEFVAREIETLLADAPLHAEPTTEDHATTRYCFADCAILVPTPADAQPIAAALRRAGIPFHVHDHEPLLAHPGVRAISRRLRQRAGTRNHAGAPALPFDGTVRERIELAAREAAVAQELRLPAPPVAGANADTTAADIRAAADLLQPLAQHFDRDVAGFLRELVVATGLDARDPDADRVSLLTLPAAQGLEFKAVFLTGIAQSEPPSRGEPWRLDETEARRLFFVGLTRARNQLTISWPRRRRRNGQIRAVSPSPLLEEVDPRLLTKHQGTPKKRRATANAPARQLALL